VYPGIDLVYYGDQGQLEYDFRVAPGSDPKQIALSFQGASARIDAGASGDLILSTEQGDVRFRAPRIYQPASGNASGNGGNAITGGFRQLAGNKIGFAIGDYDHSRELVIDPVLSYSTYLGGAARAWRKWRSIPPEIFTSRARPRRRTSRSTRSIRTTRPTSRLLMERKIFSLR